MAETFKVPSFLAQWITAQSQNRFLRVVLFGSLALDIALAYGWLQAQRAREAMQPFIVAVDPAGKWHVREAGELVYTPSQEVIKYFLTTFVESYFGRVRATVKNDFARSIYFLDEGLGEAVLQAEHKTHEIEKFMSDTSIEEREIAVSNIALEERTDSNPVYRADITYDVIYNRSHRESQREHHLLRVAFVLKRVVPVRFIGVNPLGFVIVNLSDSGPEQK